MAALLSEFTIGQIVLFVVLLAAAVKGIIEFMKWFSSTMKEKVHREERPEKIQQRLEEMGQIHAEEVAKLQQRDEELQKGIDDLKANVNVLIESDRSSTLAWITGRHHFFEEKGWIDDFSLMTIEKRFAHYKQEGGNSFAEDLMVDLRKLPKQPVTVNDKTLENYIE